MRNLLFAAIASFLVPSLLIPSLAFSAAPELPTGCYSGQLGNGATSTLRLSRISARKFAVDEIIDDLMFGFPNPDSRATYNVRRIKGRNYYRGVQAKGEQVSTSVSVTSTVSLRTIDRRKVRYHRYLRERFADGPLGPPQKTKGTLKPVPCAT